jgi:hypothetical protein
MIANNDIYNTLITWNKKYPEDIYTTPERWNFANYSGEWSNIKKHSDDITTFL